MQIAQTILQQLGGNRFAAMTGAKHFMADTERNSLTFRLTSNFAKDGINLVRVTLTLADLYTVEFMKARGLKCATIATRDDVYADQLREIFTSTTGLDVAI